MNDGTHSINQKTPSGGQLIYSLVARGGTVLAEYTESTGNFTTITQSILGK
jgi:altronate dehydratase